MIKALAVSVAIFVATAAFYDFCLYVIGIPFPVVFCLWAVIFAVTVHLMSQADIKKQAVAAETLTATEAKATAAQQSLNEALLSIARRESEDCRAPRPSVPCAAPDRSPKV